MKEYAAAENISLAHFLGFEPFAKEIVKSISTTDLSLEQ
jgi:hypothetical protein